MLKIEVKKETFNKIKRMCDSDFNAYLKNQLHALIIELNMKSEKKLMEKKKEIQRRLARIIEEIAELTEFCERAERDKKMIEEWIDISSDENERLLKEMKL